MALADSVVDRKAQLEARLRQMAEGRRWLEGMYPWQWNAACYGTLAKRWILGDEPGLGKTRSATAWLDLVGARKVILLCEANICSQFAEEIRDLAPHRNVVELNGRTADKRHLHIDDLVRERQAVAVVNFEMFRQDRSALAKLARWGADTIVVDEAHNLKATKTGNFKNVQTLVFFDNTCPKCGSRIDGLYDHETYLRTRHKTPTPCLSCHWRKGEPTGVEYATQLDQALNSKSAKNLLLLTGTPILNAPQDLYALCHLMDPTTWPTFAQYRKNYMIQNFATGRWEWRDGRLELLRTQLRGRFLARKKADVFTWDAERRGWILPDGGFLPDQHVEIVEFSLDPELYPLQYRTIRQITERAMIQLSNGELTTIAAIIAVITRKRQANVWPGGIVIRDTDKASPTFGEILFEVGKEVRESAKMDVIEQNIYQLWQAGSRQIVFSQFTTALDELERRLVRKGMRVAKLTGDTTKKQRDVVKQDFYAAKAVGPHKYDVVLAQYRSGGTGLNLTAATETHILDEEWSPGRRTQGYGRTFRIGQSNRTRVWVYRMRNTVDVWLARLLDAKEQMLEQFDGAMAPTKDDMKNSLIEGMQNGEIL